MLYFSKDHEYAKVDGDTATIGISDHAQAQLGDVVFVDLPKVGRRIAKGESVAVVESVKAASDIFAPVAGEVVAVNDALEANPSLVNEDALGKGWMFKVKVAAAPEGLMDPGAYESFLKTLG
jgi:glycine cleavage system H protein